MGQQMQVRTMTDERIGDKFLRVVDLQLRLANDLAHVANETDPVAARAIALYIKDLQNDLKQIQNAS